MKTQHWLLFSAAYFAASWLPAQTLDNPRVLFRQVVPRGDHKIIFERIVPPVLPTKPAQAGTAPASALPRRTLSLSCTVYGHEFTELRWRDAEGGEYVVWSSLDFTPFTGRNTGGFDQDGVHYEVIMGLGQARAVEAAALLAAFHSIVPPTESGSWYAVLQQPEPLPAGTFDGINALHLWFEANKVAVIAEHEAIKAANVTRKVLEDTQPKVRSDTLMRFWPIQSVLYGIQPPSTTNGHGEDQP
jgi:hypothetical protein